MQGPTPYAGLPALYAARTSPMPPVARMTAVSRAFISSCVPSIVTVDIQLIAPSGAPAFRAASFITSATREMQRTAAGCGLMTIEQRAFREIRIL